MIKFNLQYKITVQDRDFNNVIISSFSEVFKDNQYCPTVDITVNKNNISQGNNAKIIIYNLGKNTRKNLKKSIIDTTINRQVIIEAGYQTYTTIIFIGNISSCFSYRESENIITEINCNNSFATENSKINLSIKEDKDILNTMVNNLKDTSIGYITKNDILKVSYRGRSFQGKVWDIINENNEDLDIFIDDKKLYIMAEDEIKSTDKVILDNETGLLQEPKEYDGYIELKTIFEPLATLNGEVVLNSELLPEYNGSYKCIGFNHKITISKIGGSSDGITTWKLLYSYENFKKINNR